MYGPAYVEGIVKEHLWTTVSCGLNILQTKCMTKDIGDYTISWANKFKKRKAHSWVTVSCGLKHFKAKDLTVQLGT